VIGVYAPTGEAGTATRCRSPGSSWRTHSLPRSLRNQSRLPLSA
jgi:hypothetical protein